MDLSQGNKPNSNTDSRVDFVRNEVAGLSDSNININVRNGEAKAETAVGKPVNERFEFSLSAGKVRLEFAVFLSDVISKGEYIKAEEFEGLVDFFLKEKIENGELDYVILNKSQTTMVSDCLVCCKQVFLQAFSPEQHELTQENLPTPEKDLELFFAKLNTVDDALKCYENFLSNDVFSDLFSKTDEAGKYAAFNVARRVHGIKESAESNVALEQLAELLGLAS